MLRKLLQLKWNEGRSHECVLWQSLGQRNKGEEGEGNSKEKGKERKRKHLGEISQFSLYKAIFQQLMYSPEASDYQALTPKTFPSDLCVCPLHAGQTHQSPGTLAPFPRGWCDLMVLATEQDRVTKELKLSGSAWHSTTGMVCLNGCQKNCLE